jgi:phosphate transport system ATP-binding protein
MMCVLKAEDFGLWINGVQILKNVDLCIPEHKITVFIGPSGSGKTSMLRSFNRLNELYNDIKIQGDILFKGVSIFDWDPQELRSKIGMVFQTPNPFPHMSIYENVAFPLKIRGIKDKEEVRERVRWALEEASLWEEVKNRLHEYPGILSGGQKQRLSIARAIVTRPEVLLLDEPTSSIDPANTMIIEKSLIGLKKETTIVLVTHSIPQAKRIGEYFALIYHGKLVTEGTYEEVFVKEKNPIIAMMSES